MEDIRNIKNKSNIKTKVFLYNIFAFLKKNWKYLLLILMLLTLIMCPNIVGNLFGKWWNIFALNFLKNITY